ncbi:hypothetical protein [Aneurinibacillus danicus]|jgi:hypothetical protein|uniref:Uncharacterized protein n=1 Tax=Aneurinibacillus danicus TaxID=267746 RepID=A0A511VF64_9BACL|nr:hypothetical protein [Aneurinibacillus danicus]GEN36598.1 hypothetical protein ADA01nite_40580 [Aneurinibacillus danicus]
MPVKNGDLKAKDPFMVNQEEVNQAVEAFLKNCGCTSIQRSQQKGDAHITAQKDGLKIFVESRGNRAMTHTGDTVFDSAQLWTHLCEQVAQFMKRQQYFTGEALYIAANPDIPRIRTNIEKIDKALDRLGIIRAWVQEDRNVIVDVPSQLQNFVFQAGLISK